MQAFPELSCSECYVVFSSAALLLKHFAFHASSSTNEKNANKLCSNKGKIPDLFPIGQIRNDRDNMLTNNLLNPNYNNQDEIFCNDGQQDIEKNNCDLEVNDFVNPLNFCVITMDDPPMPSPKKEEPTNKCNLRKYQCSYCSRIFGWSTDLKRHILTHTGEKPFKCTLCNFACTRKFLLQKHLRKKHPGEYAVKDDTPMREYVEKQIPQLNPIESGFKKAKLDEKRTIKHKSIETTNVYQSIEVN